MTINYNSARTLIENVLRGAKRPLNAVEIAHLSGQPRDITQSRLSQLTSANKARNVGTYRHGLYVWGGKDIAPPTEAVSRIGGTGVYTGEKPLPMREGAQRCYELPSMVNGVRVERKVPVILSSMPEHRA